MQMSLIPMPHGYREYQRIVKACPTVGLAPYMRLVEA